MPERAYLPGKDDPAVLALRAKVWGVDHPHTNAGFFKWLFQDTPDGVGSGVVSEKDGKIIGYAGISRRTAQIGKNPIRIAHGLEFMVDPDLSGMMSGRVARRIMEAHTNIVVEQGYDCNLNYPNESSRRLLTLNRVKFDLVFEPDLYVRPLPQFSVSDDGQRSGLKRLVVSSGGKFGALYAGIRSLGITRRTNIERIHRFDARFDLHWTELQTDGRVRFTRDADTLNWRYIGHPLYTYSIFAAFADGKVNGYIVTSPRHVMGIDARLICDFSVADGTKGTRQRLLDAAISDAKAGGAGAIVCQSTPNDSTNKTLRRCGFLRVPPKHNPKSFQMVARSHHPETDAVLAGDNWSFNWGDMDVV